jgi:hypothetical protein
MRWTLPGRCLETTTWRPHRHIGLHAPTAQAKYHGSMDRAHSSCLLPSPMPSPSISAVHSGTNPPARKTCKAQATIHESLDRARSIWLLLKPPGGDCDS